MRLFLAVVCAFCHGASSAQTADSRLLEQLTGKGAGRTQDARTAQDVPGALDGPVDPAQYRVGPGDLLGVNVWSSSPVQVQVRVTPEGSLLIPDVGVVDVRGRTLAAVKVSVDSLVRSRYTKGSTTVLLLGPRPVAVKIHGQVLNEGPIEMRSTNRVGQLIARANAYEPGLMDEGEFAGAAAGVRASSSQRNILLRRRDGRALRVDLLTHELTGEGRHNPYLEEGDYVFVPRRDDLSSALGVFGAVTRPGRYEFVPGDSLRDLLALGLGALPSTGGTTVLFSRLSPDGARMDTVTFPLEDIGDGTVPNVPLRPGDRLVLTQAKELRLNYFVSLEGAVAHPGLFPIATTSRLRETVALAGGFAADANIANAVLLRTRLMPSASPDDVAREHLLNMRSRFGFEDTAYYRIESQLRLEGESVSVDFERLFYLGDSTQDVRLFPFDRIVVPARSNSIYVFGQVRLPGHVPFIPGAKYTEYIEHAGGLTDDAVKGSIRVVKGGNRVWLDPEETEIHDGDMIWVPRDSDHPTSYYIALYAQVAAIVAAIATVGILLLGN